MYNGSMPGAGGLTVTGGMRTNRILVLSLLVGMLTMTGVFVMLRSGGSPPTTGSTLTPELFAGVMGAMAVGSVPLMFVIPAVQIKQAGARFRAAPDDAARDTIVMQTFSIATILKCALVEGIGLFGAVAYFLTGTWALLAVPALAALAILFFFPTEGKLRRLRERIEMAHP